MSDLLQYVANTHSEGNTSARLMTKTYHESIDLIKGHVRANEDDVLIAYGSGMTAVVNKFQRILGLKWPVRDYLSISDKLRPVVFVTHQEHHSNQTSWEETIATVVVVPPDDNGSVSKDNFRSTLIKFKDRVYKYASISACSNVTGICTPYHEIAELMHEQGGFCFVDFATSFGYEDVFMRRGDGKNDKLDAIFFSPHKLLGGPGSSGIAIFDKKLYSYLTPDCVGGGIVKWTDPWGGHSFVDDIEAREDSGTPGFLQVIRSALAIRLKEDMGVGNIKRRERQLNCIMFGELDKIPSVRIIEGDIRDRISIFSFVIDDLHYNVAMKMLNDRFGIQARAGCSCAGTLAHRIFNITTKEKSLQMTNRVEIGDYSSKPGWVRVSLHPTMSNTEALYICNAIRKVAENHKTWITEYDLNQLTNECFHEKDSSTWYDEKILSLFSFDTSKRYVKVNPSNNPSVYDSENDDEEYATSCFCDFSPKSTLPQPTRTFLETVQESNWLRKPQAAVAAPAAPLRMLSRAASRSGP